MWFGGFLKDFGGFSKDFEGFWRIFGPIEGFLKDVWKIFDNCLVVWSSFAGIVKLHEGVASFFDIFCRKLNLENQNILSEQLSN